MKKEEKKGSINIMNIPKDLLEAIEERTGGNYYNDYLENKELRDIYEEASIDLLDLVITLKRNIYEILKKPNKYKINEETKKLLEELLEYRNKGGQYED